MNVGPNVSFNKLLGDVEAEVPAVAGYRATLSNLNNARVAFKHHGLSVPNRDDAAVFVANVKSFLADVTEASFGIDFESVSLVDAIGHRRTQNWIRKAQEALADGRNEEAMQHVASALAIYLAHDRRQNAGFGLGSPSVFGRLLMRPLGLGELTEMVEWIDGRLARVEERLDLATRGVDIASYERFRALAPSVSISLGGSVQIVWHGKSEVAGEDVRFCVNFAIDTALSLRESRLGAFPSDSGPMAKVVTACDVLVAKKSEGAEVIRVADVGELLLVADPQEARRDESDYFAVVQDGDVAYVSRGCVELQD